MVATNLIKQVLHVAEGKYPSRPDMGIRALADLRPISIESDISYIPSQLPHFHIGHTTSSTMSTGRAALLSVGGRAVGPVGFGMLGKLSIVCFLHSRVRTLG